MRLGSIENNIISFIIIIQANRQKAYEGRETKRDRGGMRNAEIDIMTGHRGD